MLKKLLQRLGPGFITGTADNDPSGIQTYSQTGAQFGYQQLWLVLISWPFMIGLQEMCGRIGVVTGRGLSAVISEQYPKPVIYCCVFILCITNAVNIGADLGAMAESLQLLWKLPFAAWLGIMTLLTLALEIFVAYEAYARYLKFLGFLFLAYILSAFLVHVDWHRVGLATLVPHVSLDKEYLLNLMAMLGTTISPYVCFWQANEEVEELIDEHKLADAQHGHPKITQADITEMRQDTAFGMFFSQVITFFIMVTAAATLHQHGIRDIQTAAQAAQALKPLAGPFTFALFSLGIIGAGLLSVPVMAGSSAYAVAGAFGWEASLADKWHEAKPFYSVIGVSILAGVLVNFLSIPPFRLLYYTAILNGFISPPLIIIIMLTAGNRAVMGKQANPWISTVLGLTLAGVMALVAVALLFQAAVH
jgi:NRAMP (natural resistance-associated macrophage protein)-like metal ion transporter